MLHVSFVVLSNSSLAVNVPCRLARVHVNATDNLSASLFMTKPALGYTPPPLVDFCFSKQRINL
jgi:hypothetical protein